MPATVGGTLLYDAVYLASDELMKKQQGRKALIVLTDGVDHGSKRLSTKPSRQRSAPTRSSIASCLLTRTRMAKAAEVLAATTCMGAGERVEAAEDIPAAAKNRTRMARRFLSKSLRLPAAVSLKSQKRTRSTRSTLQSTKNCATNMSWDTRHERSETTAGYHKLHLAVKQKDLIVQARDGFYLEH